MDVGDYDGVLKVGYEWVTFTDGTTPLVRGGGQGTPEQIRNFFDTLGVVKVFADVSTQDKYSMRVAVLNPVTKRALMCSASVWHRGTHLHFVEVGLPIERAFLTYMAALHVAHRLSGISSSDLMSLSYLERTTETHHFVQIAWETDHDDA